MVSIPLISNSLLLFNALYYLNKKPSAFLQELAYTDATYLILLVSAFTTLIRLFMGRPPDPYIQVFRVNMILPLVVTQAWQKDYPEYSDLAVVHVLISLGLVVQHLYAPLRQEVLDAVSWTNILSIFVVGVMKQDTSAMAAGVCFGAGYFVMRNKKSLAGIDYNDWFTLTNVAFANCAKMITGSHLVNLLK